MSTVLQMADKALYIHETVTLYDDPVKLNDRLKDGLML